MQVYPIDCVIRCRQHAQPVFGDCAQLPLLRKMSAMVENSKPVLCDVFGMCAGNAEAEGCHQIKDGSSSE